MDIVRKHDINGAEFSVLSCGGQAVLVDTVPAAYAAGWLGSAPQAAYLLLINGRQYPQTVKYYLENVPNGKIILTSYMQYTLEGILDMPLPCVTVTKPRELVLEEATLQLSLHYAPMQPVQLVCRVGETVLGVAEKAEKPEVQADFVTVAYMSGSNYTEKMAQVIAKGITDSGALNVQLLDICSADTGAVLDRLRLSGAFLLGVPTTGEGEAPQEIWALLAAMRKADFAAKVASVFGSYTKSGAAVEHTMARLAMLDVKLADKGFSVQYRLGETEKNAAYEYGYNFGCVVLGRGNDRRSKLVKCLVCGEIFDSSLDICPVCGVGMDKCVPVDEEAVGFACDTDRRYVILGGGIAALSAAEAIRKRDKTGSIVMLSAEKEAPINRPMLSKNMVAAALVDGKFAVKQPQWYEENGIALRLGTVVAAIDTEKKTVSVEGSADIAYDRLVYSLGAECYIPPIDGSDKDNVFCVRHLDDVKEIWKSLDTVRNVVVIGGGVLGLEAAAEMKKARKKVTVLEMAPRIMARQIDEECANRLVRAAENYGITIKTGVQIEGIEGETRATGVRLADGTVIPAGVVIVSCGNAANSQIAQQAGIDCGRAVEVDSRMRTSAEDVYACGDCAQLNGVNLQLWQEASEQGKIAGANAAGDSLRYVPTPMGVSFEGMNTSLYAVGDIGNGGREYKTVEHTDELSGSWRKYWFTDGKLCGAELFGDTEKMAQVIEWIDKGTKYSQIKDML